MFESENSPKLQQLLQRACAGDESAYETAFASYRRQLHQLVDLRLGGRLRQRIDASDVVQDTYLETLRRLPEYLQRQPMPFEIWLKRSARQQLARSHREHAQAAKRSVGREQALPDNSSMMLAQCFAAREPTPSEAATRRENRDAVQAAIERLSDADRELLLMRHVEDLSHRDIALLLDIDQAAARKRYGRALIRLRQQLADVGVED